MKPRILIFSTAYAPLVGGAEVAIREITDRLIEYEFELITARFDKALAPEERIGNVQVHRLGVGGPMDKWLLPLLGLFKIFKLAKTSKIDVFWCVQAAQAAGAAYVYNLLNFSHRVPVVLTLQEGELSPGKRAGLVDFSWRRALARTQYLTAISTYLQKRAQEFGYRGKSKIVPNGVSLERFAVSYKKNERLAIRKSIGLTSEDMVLVTTSRLVPKNAVADVIKALAYLPKEVKFLVVGSGPLEMPLKALAKEYRVSDRVVWKGSVPNRDLPPLLGASDIFVRPSLSEGQGVSFMEAMAAQVPVIATAVGGIPDFLKDGVTGLVCEVSNPVSIAECVKRINANPALRKELIKRASSMVAERYTWETVIQDMNKVFAEVLALNGRV